MPGFNYNGQGATSMGLNDHNSNAPTASDIAHQYNSYGGRQISASDVSNIRSDGEGGYQADIRGGDHTVSSEAGSEKSNTLGGFTGKGTNPGQNNSGGAGNQSGNNSNGSHGNGSNITPSTWDRTAHYYSSSDQVSRRALKNMYEKALRIGKIPDEARGDLRQKVQAMLDEDKQLAAEAEKKKQDEKDLLLKTSEIISDMGDKLGEHLGDKYKEVAMEISGEIKNFQGKTIRSYNDAMASLNKITSNPGMKINAGDRDALVNAWQHVNAQDMANKLGNLSAAFRVADTIMKIEKVREKSIVGYQTGNWGPLMLEVESWVIGGIAGSIAMGIFSATLGTFALSLGAPAVAVGIAGVIVAGTVAALIDDKLADKINNEVIRPAH